MYRKTTVAHFCVLLVVVFLTYENHFENAFQFDDSHAVVGNPHIRNLRNIPLFFTDAKTFSSLPANQSYRPLVSTSLAVDYRIGNGLKPFYFHASTFIWFLLQLGLMYVLFRRVFDAARFDSRNRAVALFATAWYGLHPAIAETVNYVVQRGDVYATLGVIGGLVVYACGPQQRKFGLYLLPVAAALLSKPTALVFPAMLFVYIRLFEEEAPSRALTRCIPALLVAVGFGWLTSTMTPEAYNPGAASGYAYRVTQPLVVLRYFRTFFLPLYLTADTDHSPIHSIFEDWAWAGFVFVVALIVVAGWCSRHREWRPTSFGIWWFLIALFPTSIFALAEIENDHRMYFPFVGLALSISWSVALCLDKWLPRRRLVAMAKTAVCLCLVAACAWGTRQRNEIWRTEESLWYDVTLKSPHNGRGLMNYGLTQLAKGEPRRALDYFERAKIYTPAYSFLEINLGIANGALNQDDAAHAHFERAIELAPSEARSHYYYARWLNQKGRWQEALAQLQQAVAINANYIDARHLLMRILSDQADWAQLETAAESTLRRFPFDATALSHLREAGAAPNELTRAEQSARSESSPDAYLDLSFQHHRAGRFQDCIAAAKEALRLRPDDADAYNNIAAGYEGLRMWDAAIEAARKALQIRPDFQLARNNLNWAEAQKKRAAE